MTLTQSATPSTTTPSTTTDPTTILNEAWALSPSVALRPEPFGALAYHFDNRKLTFLKRPELVAVVRALADSPDVRSALLAAGVPATQHAAYAGALRNLAANDLIRPRASQEEQP